MTLNINNFVPYVSRLSIAWKTFLIIVVLPTIIAAIYYGLIASDIYISEARYAVRTNSETSSSGIIDSIFGSNSASPSAADSHIVRDYILSRDMMIALDKELDLKSHYQSSNIDYFSRLPRDATQEEFYKYYLKMISINLESDPSIATLHVRSYSPEFSRKVAALIIDKSETLVNDMTKRIIADSLKFAKSEVANAEDLVRKTSDAMSNFRNEYKSIDPEQETSGVLKIVTDLEAELAKSRAELLQAESYMKPGSVQVKNLRSKVTALEKQISKERQRLAGNNGNDQNMNKLIYDYEPLELNQKLAEREYTSALTSLELARVDAQRKQRYLITFVTPKAPDEAVEPERFMQVITVFFASLLIYAIGGLVWAAIKDHMRY